MEALKERIKIYLAIFQFGMTIFLGTGVSLVTYINKQMDLRGLTEFPGMTWDVIGITHVLFMIFAASFAVYAIVRADSINDDLVDEEESLK